MTFTFTMTDYTVMIVSLGFLTLIGLWVLMTVQSRRD